MVKKLLLALLLIPQLGCAALVGSRFPEGGTIPSGEGTVLPPQQISGLEAWYDASRGTFQNTTFNTPARATDDVVLGWLDQSGKGRHLNTGSGSPLLKLAVQNGLPGVLFSGSSQYLQSLNWGTIAQPFTLIVSFKGVAYGAGDRCIVGSDGTTTMIERESTSGQLRIQGSASLAGPSFSDTTLGHVALGVFNGAGSLFYLDNVTLGAGDAGTNSFNGFDVAQCASASGANIYVYETMLYSKQLSATEISNIYTYLAKKWGL